MISTTSDQETAHSAYMKKIGWEIIDTMFQDNEKLLVAHHLDSYNYFMNVSISNIFIENNPIQFVSRSEADKDEQQNTCLLYLGGKDGKKIYYGQPTIYHDATDEPYSSFLFPNDARLNNMTYGITIHYDVDVEMKYWLASGEQVEYNTTLQQIYLGRFPIMVQSSLCVLASLNKHVRFNMGECRNDVGGYFIINGKEKVIVSQERFAPNQLKIKTFKQNQDGSYNQLYTHSSSIYSVSEDSSKPTRNTTVGIIAPTGKYKGGQIVVDIPNVKKPVPLFVLMRAFGVLSDKEIIETCLLRSLSMSENSKTARLFLPSIYDGAFCTSQQNALEFIAQLMKHGTIPSVLEVLSDFLLPHLGEDNFIEKAYYIGYMVNQMIKVVVGEAADTDPDSFKNKRIELTGDLLYSLFREYYLVQKKNITQNIDKEYYYHSGEYTNTIGGEFRNLISAKNIIVYFKDRLVEEGVNKGLRGNWGSQANTRREGIVQDLNRLSWCTASSHLRKINLHMEEGSKLVAPRLLNSTQWGYIDVLDSPDGGNTGLHKHLAISCYVTRASPKQPIIDWVLRYTSVKKLTYCTLEQLHAYTKLFVNGDWIGVTNDPLELNRLFLLCRRNGILPTFSSISFNYQQNEIHIFTDAGRLSRPIFHIPTSYTQSKLVAYYQSKWKSSSRPTWNQLITGFISKPEFFNYKNNDTFLNMSDLYSSVQSADYTPEIVTILEKHQAPLDFMDISEETSSHIAMSINEIGAPYQKYTHLEIDPSFILGVMGNFIIYPNHNQLPRNVFSCGQSRQAVSMYHTNYRSRMDKMGVVLMYGQCPLIKSAYMKYINNEENVYGVNAIVAIMSYTGYNVEDAILFNKSSIERGMFNTAYFTTYESSEQSAEISQSSSIIMNTASSVVTHKSQGYDYDQLGENGIIRENTIISDNTIVIGNAIISKNADGTLLHTDNSSKTKRGQLGRVDKTFITSNKEGFNIAKVRVVELRYPAIGDKFASRAGQKGTVGLIIDEQDMPFTADGIRPDLIINPHALPSRMTISQLIETLFGKVCVTMGSYGDSTAFKTIGSNYSTYAPYLNSQGFHSAGTELMYNGSTGEQLESDIFIGPTYYMRLKHMVKDKINYRAKGKNEELTRQPVQGRAKDGGLRLGEMERDGILAHGLSSFLNDAFMHRADEYSMAVCNKTGTIAIYNKSKDLFLSPHADGPIQFITNIDSSLNIQTLSQFGRSFSIVRVPYCLKLLMQELECMNISMRIITDQSDIDYFSPTQYSDTIQKVMISTTSLDDTIINIKQVIQSKQQKAARKPAIANAAAAAAAPATKPIEKEKMSEQLPAPLQDWTKIKDIASGQYYYHNSKTNKTTWTMPTAEPTQQPIQQPKEPTQQPKEPESEWEKVFSKTHNAYYWFNKKTGKTTWTVPTTMVGGNGKEEKTREETKKKEEDHSLDILQPIAEHSSSLSLPSLPFSPVSSSDENTELIITLPSGIDV